MTQLYTGIVAASPRFETKEWGETVSVNVKMDDPEAPKTNDKGYAWVNSKPGSTNGSYLEKLEKGDSITMVYTERGGKGFYNPVIPSGSSSPNGASPTTKSTPVPVKNGAGKVYNLLTEADELAFGELVEEGLRLFKTTWNQTTVEFPTTSEPTPAEVYKIAFTAFSYAEKRFSPGMKVTKTVPPYQRFMDEVGTPESLHDILSAIAKTAGTSVERAQNIVKKFGFTSDDLMIDGDKSRWIDAFQVVDRFIQKTANGVASGTAIEQVATELGLSVPDLL